MSESIDQLKGVFQAVMEGVNAQQKLAKVEWKQAYKEVLDLSEGEAQELAAAVGMLDLNDDELELRLESYAQIGGQYAAFVLRMLKIVLPKPKSV